jgi:hypothetical protein
MPKKTNNIFTTKNIFDFSHPRFNTIKTQSKGSGLEGKIIWSSGAEVRKTFSVAHKEL